jgi:hypothetical protein
MVDTEAPAKTIGGEDQIADNAMRSGFNIVDKNDLMAVGAYRAREAQSQANDGDADGIDHSPPPAFRRSMQWGQIQSPPITFQP